MSKQNLKHNEEFYTSQLGFATSFSGFDIVGHFDSINQVIITSDDKYLISCSKDKTIKVWNLSDGTLKYTFTGHKRNVRCVCITSDLKYVISGGEDNLIKIWELNSGKLQKTIRNFAKIICICTSKDNKNLFCGTTSNTIEMYEIQSGEHLKSFYGHSGDVIFLKRSFEGKTLISCSTDRSVKVWDTSTGISKLTLRERIGDVFYACDTKDGKYLLTVCYDGILKIWDYEDFKTNEGSLKNLRGQGLIVKNISAISISLDGRRIYAGYENNQLFSGELKLDKIRPNQYFSGFIMVNPSSGIIWSDKNTRCNNMSLSKSGKYLISCSNEGHINLRDVFHDKNLYNIKKGYSVQFLRSLPNSRNLIYGNTRGEIYSRNYLNGEIRKIYNLKSRNIEVSQLSRDCKILINLSKNLVLQKTIEIWDLEKNTLIKKKQENQDNVNTIQISNSGSHYVLGGKYNHMFTLYELKTEKLLQVFVKQNYSKLMKYDTSSKSIIFTPDDNYIVSLSEGKIITIWNIRNLNLYGLIDVSEFVFYGMKVITTNKYIAINSKKNIINLYDFQTQRLVKTLVGHSEMINDLVFSEDGKIIVSGGADKSIRVWNIEDDIFFGPFSHQFEIIKVTTIPNSNYVAGMDINGEIFIWDYSKSKKKDLKLNELKTSNIRILFVGDMNVGKTCLVNRLSEQKEIDMDISSTLGCEIRVVPGEENKFYWDFGGQQQYRIVHQFFTQGGGCICTIVFDGERFGSGKQAINTLRYWVESVVLNTYLKPKIVIVINKCDAIRTFSVPTKFIAEVKKLVKKFNLNYPKIIKTSAKTGEGLEALKDEIQIFSQELSVKGTKLASEIDFSIIEDTLEKLREEGKIVISMNKLIKNVKNYYNNRKGDEYPINDDHLMVYLDHLEAGGEILILSKFEVKFNYIVLEPMLISKVLSAVSLVANKNNEIISKDDFNDIKKMLSYDDVFNTLYGEKYLKSTKHWLKVLLDFAVKFDICIKEEENSWRILSFQNEDQSEDYFDLIDRHDTILIQYFMIENLPEIFITSVVQMLINNYNLKILENWHRYDKYGALLQSFSDSDYKFFMYVEAVSPKKSENQYYIGFRLLDGDLKNNFKFLNEVKTRIILNLLLYTNAAYLIPKNYILCSKCNTLLVDDLINKRNVNFCQECGNQINLRSLEYEALPRIDLNKIASIIEVPEAEIGESHQTNFSNYVSFTEGVNKVDIRAQLENLKRSLAQFDLILDGESQDFHEKMQIARKQIEKFVLKIRAFIEKKLRENYDDDWWEKGIPEVFRKNVERMLNMKKKYNPNTTFDPMEYLDFSNYFHIISKDNNWNNIFSKIFPEKRGLEFLLDQIREFRNDLGHFHMHPQDFNRLPVYINDVLKYFEVTECSKGES